jgi:type IV pilus biogenesis protein CpaD/CtpE
MMSTIRSLLSCLALVLLSTGCAAWNKETATERDFGNSVRSMIANQTANPEPAAPDSESGDGPRLEAVLESYRADAGSRQAIDGEIIVGPSGGNR